MLQKTRKIRTYDKSFPFIGAEKVGKRNTAYSNNLGKILPLKAQKHFTQL